ncbi:MAG TPA: penicillin-binding transpeptidase domain-containing protein [Verrucomicrobiae bacterium]
MLILDELKKNDPHLRLVALVLAGGLFILLAGLWWVQVVSAHDYQVHLETQSYRTIRVPAVRGKILDRDGHVLAENVPRYNLSLYLDDLRSQFSAAYDVEYARATNSRAHYIAAQEKKLGRALTKAERKQFAFSRGQLRQLGVQARARAAAGVVARLGEIMGQPLAFSPKDFENAYQKARAMPYPILKNLDAAQIARFEENYPDGLGADLDLQSVRSYPFGTTAAHLLGELHRDNDSVPGEEAYFSYRLPDYRGVTGVEGKYDSVLHGRAGVESVLVNNYGYRQTNDMDSAPQPGETIVLTLDLDIQRSVEESLVRRQGAEARAAVVVMNVRNGDVLAMASSPTFDPNDFAQGWPPGKYQQFQESGAEKNRATYENYAPGSIFKPIVALAALEAGLNPDATVDNPGYVMVGRRRIGDEAPVGKYNLRKAIIESCNTYFVTIGLRADITNIVQMAEKFHFGESTEIFAGQETPGIFPTLKQVQSPGWRDGDSANICIGQGKMAVTPMQMAVAYAAIANGGTVLWPRLVERIEPQDAAPDETATNFPAGLVRDHLGVSARNLQILHDAMLAETVEGTGRPAQVPGLQICGKTGTAQVMNSRNQETGRTTWFASFAPYEHPRYCVVVMVENGTYGGPTCAPIAHDIYETILQKETTRAKTLATVK